MPNSAEQFQLVRSIGFTHGLKSSRFLIFPVVLHSQGLAHFHLLHFVARLSQEMLNIHVSEEWKATLVSIYQRQLQQVR